MRPLTERELRMNRQAVTIAAAVLSEPVEAATRCERATQDMIAEYAGVGKFSRGVARFFNRAPAIGQLEQMGRRMETGGLPERFILAVTSGHVHAIEDKTAGDDLVAGAVLESWARAGFKARTVTPQWNLSRGVPDDRQLLILWIPIEPGKNRYLQAGARSAAAAGQPGFPTNFVVAKDPSSQRVIDVLDAAGHVRVISGSSFVGPPPARQADPTESAPPKPTTAQRLQELEILRMTGAVSEAEYTRKREQIISEL